MDISSIRNPKQTRSENKMRSHWYPYYAGYSASFVHSCFDAFSIGKGSKVLDPWVGGGTTLFCAASRGISSVGIDFNPVMIIVAKARCIRSGGFIVSKAIALDAIANYRSTGVEKDSSTLLNLWFDEETSHRIIRLEKSLRRTRDISTEDLLIGNYTPEFALSYLALFRFLRNSINRLVGSNKTWIKPIKTIEEKINLSEFEIISAFSEQFSYLHGEVAFRISDHNPIPAAIVGDSRTMRVGSSEFDFVIGSPPYSTRIDYIVATSPELALMGFDQKALDASRREVIGSVLTSGYHESEMRNWGVSANIFLEKLYRHPSKASQTYYFNSHRKYFSDLYNSFAEISRITAEGGIFAMVIQDSYYKEIHNDLAKISTEMLSSMGLIKIGQKDFPVKNSIGNLNPRVKNYRNSASAIESTLFFAKEKS